MFAHNFVYVQLVLVAIRADKGVVVGIKDGFFAVKFVLANVADAPVLGNIVELTTRTFFVFQW